MELPDRINCLVSAVTFLTSDGGTTNSRIAEIQEFLSTTYTHFEVIVVESGAPDRLVQDVVELLEVLPCIRLLRLGREYSGEICILAGIDYAIGDFILVDKDIERFTTVMQNAVELCRSGTDIVHVDDRSSDLKQRSGLRGRSRSAFDLRSGFGIVCLGRRVANAVSRGTRSDRLAEVTVGIVGFRRVLMETDSGNAEGRRTEARGRIWNRVGRFRSRIFEGYWSVVILASLGVIVTVLKASLLVMAQRSIGSSVPAPPRSFEIFLDGAATAVGLLLLGLIGVLTMRLLRELRESPGYLVVEDLHSTVLIHDASQRNVRE